MIKNNDNDLDIDKEYTISILPFAGRRNSSLARPIKNDWELQSYLSERIFNIDMNSMLISI